MGPVADTAMATLGDSIVVEMGVHAGFDMAAHAADDLFIEGPIKQLIPIHSKVLETTGVKTLTITLKFLITVEDAALGFFRSSLHK
jgi:hypothetical protein